MSALLLKDYYVIFRQMKIRMGKIPDCTDAVTHQKVCHFLCILLRKCQGCDLNVMLLQKSRKLVCHTDQNSSDCNAFQLWIYIEQPFDQKTVFFKFYIICKSLSEISGTDDDHIVILIQAQNLPDLRM